MKAAIVAAPRPHGSRRSAEPVIGPRYARARWRCSSPWGETLYSVSAVRQL